MAERQFLVFRTSGLCLLLFQLVFSLSDDDNVTFKNVSVQWCEDEQSNCVNTTISRSSSLTENIPFGHVNFKYVTISYQNVPILYEDSVTNIKLKLFELSSSGLAAIERGALTNLVVHTLSFKNNTLQKLGKGIFKNTLITFELDFSKNAIKHIENGTFQLLKLNRLDLSGNSFEDIAPGVLYNISLGHLDLSKNNIKSVHKASFQNMIRLESVDLSSNKIKFIETGTFHNLPKIFCLYLHNNYLNSIPTGLFSDSLFLELYLMGNNISSISPGAFKNMGAVYLHLSYNKLEEISNGIFDNSSVEYLTLSHNEIREIESDALDSVSGGVALDFNELHTIKTGTFKRAIVLLLLNNRKLKKIEPGAFNGTSNSSNQHITRVPKFYLERNNSLDEESRDYLNNLTESGRFIWHDHIGTDIIFPFAG